MKYFDDQSNEKKNEIFYKEPEAFTKFSEREILMYALGATLYMPAIKPSIAEDIIKKKYPELTSLVIDLEDAIGDSQLECAEEKLISHIQEIDQAVLQQRVVMEELPLIFVRVRNPEQMKRLTLTLGSRQRVLTGYVFPKFSHEDGKKYLDLLKRQNCHDVVLYGMPILESAEIINKETRMQTLLELKALIDEYRSYILNVRIGSTDFCGLYGIRRNAKTTIYDVSIIRDCLVDIINIFNRKENGYVLSGPVWEYFSSRNRELENPYVQGLINEVVLDKLNGIIGKTIIHPTHIKPVQALYVVSHEEYLDAMSIIMNSGEVGVLKSQYENKMNEINPHLFWAERIVQRAKVFGVYNEGYDYTHLLLAEAKTYS